MAEEREFDVNRIVIDSSAKLKEKYPNAQTYLEQISINELHTHLTLGEITEITQNLLKKVEFKGDAP